MRVLVTGGAGFIGSHTTDALVHRGHSVRVFDNLDTQVHPTGSWPNYLHVDAERVQGDVRNWDQVAAAVRDMDAVIHLAAAVGVGQSMYDIRRYVDVNAVGGATVLDVLANTSHRVRRLVVASSMSIYGEGAYTCTACGLASVTARTVSQMHARDWEPRCAGCRLPLVPAPTPESRLIQPPTQI